MRGWQGPTALVLLVLLHELHAQNYQLNFQRGNDDLNDITLSCSKDGYSFSAAFWSRPTEDGSAVSIHNGTGYQFILTQQLEAYYCCGELSNVEPDSDCKPLLGKYWVLLVPQASLSLVSPSLSFPDRYPQISTVYNIIVRLVTMEMASEDPT